VYDTEHSPFYLDYFVVVDYVMVSLFVSLCCWRAEQLTKFPLNCHETWHAVG